MIADVLSNKKLNPIVTKLFISAGKVNISLVFITQSYFALSKNIRLNFRHYSIVKIPNKRELQQITLNHSPDIYFKGFINLYKECTVKPFFLVIDATLALGNPSRFRKNLLKIKKLIMIIDDKIRDEKLQYDINREAAKISALSSVKIHKYEYLTGEEIMPFNKRQIIEQAKFAYSLLGKYF